jgi:hypothetical protein
MWPGRSACSAWTARLVTSFHFVHRMFGSFVGCAGWSCAPGYGWHLPRNLRPVRSASVVRGCKCSGGRKRGLVRAQLHEAATKLLDTVSPPYSKLRVGHSDGRSLLKDSRFVRFARKGFFSGPQFVSTENPVANSTRWLYSVQQPGLTLNYGTTTGFSRTISAALQRFLSLTSLNSSQTVWLGKACHAAALPSPPHSRIPDSKDGLRYLRSGSPFTSSKLSRHM